MGKENENPTAGSSAELDGVRRWGDYGGDDDWLRSFYGWDPASYHPSNWRPIDATLLNAIPAINANDINYDARRAFFDFLARNLTDAGTLAPGTYIDINADDASPYDPDCAIDIDLTG